MITIFEKSKLVQRVLHFAIKKNINEEKLQAELLTNKMSILIFGTALIYLAAIAAVNYFVPLHLYLYLQLTQVALFLFIPLVRLAYGRVGLSIYVSVVSMIYFVLLGILTGPEADIHFAFVTFISLPFFVLGKHEKKALTFIVTLGLLGLSFLIWWNYSYPPFAYPGKLVVLIGSRLFFIVVLFIVAYLSFNYWRDTYISKEKLKNESDKSRRMLLEIIPSIRSARSKYRKIVEGSDDIIFSLNQNLTVLTFNQAWKNHLGFVDKETEGISFLDFLDFGARENDNTSQKLIKESLFDVAQLGGKFSFKGHLKNNQERQSQEYLIQLEQSSFGETIEILGKAVPVKPDILNDILMAETQTFIFENSFAYLDPLSSRVTENLVVFLDRAKINAIRICLREVLINAIEHGNLQINYNDKSKALLDGNYLDFIRERQKLAENKNKRVKLIYSLSHDELNYTITDDGAGFDYQKILNTNIEKLNTEMSSHGRGLYMTREIFDKVSFNENGNSVSLQLNLQNKMFLKD